jgi:hypothetical protein
VPNNIVADVSDCASSKTEVFVGSCPARESLLHGLQWVINRFLVFLSCSFVAGKCSPVFYLNRQFRVKADERELRELFGSFEAFQKISRVVLFVEFGEDFNGSFFYADFFEI